MTTERGGLLYGLPLSELPALSTVFAQWQRWARSNGLEPPPWLSARFQDVTATAKAMRPLRAQPDAVPEPLRGGTMDEMDGSVGTGAAARLAGCSRQALSKKLRAGRIPGAWRDELGRWHVPIDALDAKGA